MPLILHPNGVITRAAKVPAGAVVIPERPKPEQKTIMSDQSAAVLRARDERNRVTNR